MNSCNNMVTYDQWSYMLMPGILELAFKTIGERIEIDRLLFEKGRKESAILQKNCPLTACLQMRVQDLVFFLDIRARVTKQIDLKMLISGGYPVFACGRAVAPTRFCVPNTPLGTDAARKTTRFSPPQLNTTPATGSGGTFAIQ